MFAGHPRRAASAARAIESGRDDGPIVLPPVVWAEVRALFPDDAAMEAAIADAGLEFDPGDRAVATRAGALWSEYRRRGGPRTRVVADFLIAAHALERGARLVTRDRGFYRGYFTGLEVVDPGES